MGSNHTLPEDAQDNKLGFFNLEDINHVEAIGVSKAKAYILKEYKTVKLNIYTLIYLHKIAFEELYEWAGKIRKTITNIGVPPFQILERLKFFMDNLQYRLENINVEDDEEVIQLLAETHHTVVYIHPFLNGNGRVARLFTNLVAIKLLRPPFEIYIRDESKDRTTYIDAIRSADRGDFEPLKDLVRNAIEYSKKAYHEMSLDKETAVKNNQEDFTTLDPE